MKISTQHSLAPGNRIASIKRYAYTVLIPLLLLAGTAGKAQYVTVPLTGFNQDVIANGTSTTGAVTACVDGLSSFCLDSSFTALGTPPYALPTSGRLHSKLTPGLVYQLASASSNNALQLTATKPTGALSFVTPRTASVIYVLQTSTYTTTTTPVDMTVKFTDSSSQAFPAQTLYDWYTAPTPAVSGIGRIFGGLSVNGQITGALQGDTAHPCLSQTVLTITTSNTNKSIAYISFTQGTSAGPIITSTPVSNIFAISIQPPTASLPVVVTNFEGQPQGSTNLLSWTTTTEVNNKGFAVQRSADGSNFSTLSFIPSETVNGYSSTALHYQSIDAQPLATDNYYRLQQVNKDGSYTYSSTVLVKSTETNGMAVTIYPNPVTTQLNVTINAKESHTIALVISSTDGKVVMAQHIQLIIGANTLPVNASQLARGTYAIKIMAADGNTVYTSLFIK